MLEFKTIADTSPQSKRHIYFTCHPDDFKIFFDSITDEILKILDCAIYYQKEDAYENIDLDLGKMNLFVIPVTTKLLTQSCRTMKIDIPFALERHIPILPIMQEDGLDELFVKQFGDLQYLNPNVVDETAISYKEKIRKYLQAILISEELAEKVRSAFDAYIFLSYRKKDRKYANELMQLIHKNDFCRDIAIWYDEYLVPGENFNEAISKALKKSDLFTMVVTPNLVNEKNYVQTVEYPEAVKQNKRIIPANLEKTDINALKEQYPNIPNDVNARNEYELTKALESALIKIAKRENDNDPQHNFFIGLAYLEGIDVEINNDRALALITSAAEAKKNKVPAAIEKLVTMYNTGLGVERNYVTAIEWQQKLVDYWESKYISSHNIDDYNKYFSSLWKLGESLYDIRDIVAAEKVYIRMINLLDDSIKKENISVEDKHNYAAIYNKLGDIYRDQRKLTEAEALYYKALPFAEQLAEETDESFGQYDLAVSYSKLYELYKDKDDFNTAEQFCNKSIELIKQLNDKNQSIETLRDLSLSYEKLGELCIARGDLNGAEQFYLNCLNIRKRLADDSKTVEARHNLAAIYSRLGTLCRNKANLEESKKFWLNSLEISKQLAEETKNYLERRTLLITYGNLGLLYQLQGKLNEAENFFLQALYLNKQLMEETNNLELLDDLSTTYNLLGDLYRNKNDFNEARKFYQEAIIVCEMIVERNNNSKESWRKLSKSYTVLGDFYENLDILDEAEKYYRKGLSFREHIVEDSTNREDYSNLAESYFKIAIIREDRELLEKSLHIYNFLYKQYPQVTQYSFLINMIQEMLGSSE